MSASTGELHSLPAVTEQRLRRHSVRSLAWTRRYTRHVALTDRLVVIAAVLAGQVIRFGTDLMRPVGRVEAPAIVISAVLIFGWLVALRLTGSRDPRILGSLALEQNRVVVASFGLFGAWAMLDLTFNLAVARGFFACVFPLGTAALMLSRAWWRHCIMQGRVHGENLRSVLVVGSAASTWPLVAKMAKNPTLGYQVVGVCLLSPEQAPRSSTTSGRGVSAAAYGVSPADVDRLANIPVFTEFGNAADVIATCGADMVAVTSVDVLGHAAMRELSWQLAGSDVEMLIAPGLMDVAGPRITMRPESGLPLLHIDKPRYQGATKLMKLTFDKVLSAVVLVGLIPVLAACALAIKLDSPGPVFYRAERIGTNNEPFRMWKFRSMVTGADALRAELRAHSDGNTVLFKMKADPRVTRVGRFLRRYSLDELPQLFNVLGGTMSLVGPRPPLREETETYDSIITRRMLVRPGMTGLWQVSGRSDLTWEESVQLDLSYVENWSLASDVVILWRTARAVISNQGAY